MIAGTPAITITLPIQKPGAPDTLFFTSAAPRGMRAMRRRASLSSPPILAMRSFRIATASGLTSSGAPKALAMQSAVMSSCVGPMPPVVNKYVWRARSVLTASTTAASSSAITRTSLRSMPIAVR